jgi:hypothetical protein
MAIYRFDLGRSAQHAFATALVAAMTLHRASAEPESSSERRAARDRGDVPGWVMITMMTAIVVIVLLGVFQEAVVTAVKNAFDSITGQSATVGTGTP